MKIYTIKQKMSNSGTIHDIASNLYDREIRFPAGCVYAVVQASYYGGNLYTCYKSEHAAIEKSKSLESSHEIIDVYGNIYAVNYDRLERM